MDKKTSFFKSKIFIIILILVLLPTSSILIYRSMSRGFDKAIRGIIRGFPSFLRNPQYKRGAYTKENYIKKIKSNHLFVYYKDLDGLRTGDKVRYHGRKVGYVEIFWVNPEGDKRYEVLLKFRDKNFRVKKNSKFYINTLGLGNEKYVEISSPEKETEYLKKGSYVKGVEPSKIMLFLPFEKGDKMKIDMEEDIFLNFDYQKNIIIDKYVMSKERLIDLFKMPSEWNNYEPETFAGLQGKELFLVVKVHNKDNRAFWGMLICNIDGIVREAKVYLNLCGAHQESDIYVIPISEKPVDIDENAIPLIKCRWEKLYVK